MKLGELITNVNTLSDETESPGTIVSFLNDAISKINVTLNCGFPYFNITSIDEESTLELPEKWQRMLLIPYAVGRVKQRDSSQFEYSDAYGQFLENMEEMQSKYVIPNKYKDLKAGTEITLPDDTTYTVVSGDTLASIAASNNTTVALLEAELDENEAFVFSESNSYPSDIYTQRPAYWGGW